MNIKHLKKDYKPQCSVCICLCFTVACSFYSNKQWLLLACNRVGRLSKVPSRKQNVNIKKNKDHC